MPNKLKDVKEFFERMAILETKVEELGRQNVWQMWLLGGIILLLVKVALSR